MSIRIFNCWTVMLWGQRLKFKINKNEYKAIKCIRIKYQFQQTF